MVQVLGPENCLAGGGELGALMRAKDWSQTPIGPVESWPQSLRTAVSMTLESRFAMIVAWGPEFRFFYNDSYRPVLGETKHPRALGTPAKEIFPEVWSSIGPEFEGVLRGKAFAIDDWLLPINRYGYLENCYFTVSYSPIRDESGGVGGLLAIVAETTGRVEGERRLAILRALARAGADTMSSEQACERAAEVFAANPIDVPFSATYLADADGKSPRRVASSGFQGESPDSVDWPIGQVLETHRAELVTGLSLPGGPYPERTHGALVLPLARPGGGASYGVLVVGISPRRALDDRYRGFFELAADHVVAGIANGVAHEEERKRAEALAELDRAKTAFFSNVSHEFRTPLTLMLGPLEDLLAGGRGELRPVVHSELEAIHRNSLRLLKLVNSLLDFARIEAGRTHAVYEPVDLAALTRELAGVFRSAIERAGLRYVVDCPPLPEPIYVDREMWEKIVLNLLSNAFKFTFEGEIGVSLRAADETVVLEVRDTGTGMPEDALPHVFERFHRVQGARARTHEGTGIGLALVHELLRLHGGTITVESALDRGSAFKATLHTGTAHLPKERIGAKRAQASTAIRPDAFVEEASRWLPEESPSEGASIIVADDNADMRDYLRRILGERWSVEAVSDGAIALQRAKKTLPDLVITDVMMPGLDGFALLRALKSDEATRKIPVMMLSARAGEEARIEGLDAGADDYMTKPFSARELVARAAVQVGLRETLRTEEVERTRLYAGFMQAPAPIFIVRGPDAAYEMANPRWLDLIGRREDVGNELFLRATKVLADKKTHVESEAHVKSDDSWWSIACSPLALGDGVPRAITVAFEVTEQVGGRQRVESFAEQLTKALESRDEQLAFVDAILATAPIALAFFDRRLRIVRSNPVFASLDREPVLRAALEENAKQALESSASIGPLEISAADRHWLLTSYPVRDAKGAVAYAGAVIVDVTEEVKARERLGETVRYNEIFAGILGHDLRNPLTAITTTAQLLLRRATDDKNATSIERILASGERMRRMIDQLLDLTRIRIGGGIRLEPTALSLSELLQRTVDEIEIANPDRLILVEANGDLFGEWDADRLAQVISNLTANAIEHGAPGAPIVVRADGTAPNAVTIIFENRGTIAESLLPILFDPFRGAHTRTRDGSKGLGLGLYITKQIVAAHGGELTVSSNSKEGTRFTVALPRSIGTLSKRAG